MRNASWSIRALALRLASCKDKDVHAARLLWDTAACVDPELTRFPLLWSCVLKDGTVETRRFEARDIGSGLEDEGHPGSWGVPYGPSFTSAGAFQSWRIMTGTRSLGHFQGWDLWVTLSEDQERLVDTPEELLDALVGRCLHEGVGESWAPLRDAAAWLREEECL